MSDELAKAINTLLILLIPFIGIFYLWTLMKFTAFLFGLK